MNAGDTFLIAQPGTSLDSHLWIVLSDPTLDKNNIVLVNLTTWRPDKDQACLLEKKHIPGFVTHKTCVNYGGSKVVTLEQFTKLTTNLKRLAPLKPEVLKMIRRGAANSKHMKIGHFAILDSQNLIDD